MDSLPEERKKLRGRLLIFIVAYNAEKTIEAVVKRIPIGLSASYDVEILIIDDSSQDETFAKSELVKRSGDVPFTMTVLFNPENQGYGGNQKIGFHYALRNHFDWVALVHGDGQYAPECLPDLVEVLANDEADAVFGSRMMQGTSALKGGMPLYKFVGNKILTTLQNTLLGSDLSEFHSGYRLYATNALARVPFDLNSNDFHFDTEIIIQFITAGLKIKELPIPTFYGDEICHVNGLKYAWDVCRTTVQAKVQKFHIFYDRKFDCGRTEDAPQQHGSQGRSCPTIVLEQVKPGTTVAILGDASVELVTALEGKGCQVRRERADYLGTPKDSSAELDYLVILDDRELSTQPELYMGRLQDFCRYRPALTIVVAVGNIGFCLTRILLLLGRFSYSRRGIISFGHSRFFTSRSLKRLFSQYRFACTGVHGIPIQYDLVFRKKSIVTALSALHRGLIAIRPSLFGYQLLCTFRPKPSLDYLLEHAMSVSQEKSQIIS
ncbi:MAG: glycosyltransferase family 2 protein [Desulfofustis sp.]|nr:glycosyltransferase family 2 protein [Desulfofustis sp.]